MKNVSQIRQVPKTLLDKLFAIAVKYEFHVSTNSFLEFITERGHLKPDPEKNWAVLDWPVPTNCKRLQRFLVFANFDRHSIKDYRIN